MTQQPHQMKKVKKFFQWQSNLDMIINKARLFNTYLTLTEVAFMIYYNVVPKKTN